MMHWIGRMAVFGEAGKRTVVDLAAVNAVVEGSRNNHSLHLRGDREGFPVVADFDELTRAVSEAKRREKSGY